LSESNEFILSLKEKEPNKGFIRRVSDKLKFMLIQEKLNNWFGFLIFLILSVIIAYITYRKGFSFGAAILAVLIGVPFVFSCMFNLRFGISVTLIVSYFLIGATRIIHDIPLGILNDLLIATMAFGIFIKQINERDWSFLKHPVSKIIAIWILYNLLQFANPTAESRLAWVYTIRAMAGTMIMFFIVMYSINSEKHLIMILKLWLLLSLIAALYGLSQEYIGFTSFDNNWIYEDEKRVKLLFVMGHFRKFSFLASPPVFGFIMAYTSLMCIILASGPFKKIVKGVLLISSVLMILGMVYSGTRAAYAVLPAGLVFYALLTFKKKVLIGVAVFLVIGVIIVIMPTSNPNIVRIQTAFKPDKDVSYQVRVENQKFIQPYIQTHPLGGGLGSTGTWGERFSPNSPLSKFPPDSGYVRIAVELGWVGLIIYCLLLSIVFYVGIKDYFRIKNPKLKIISAALLTSIYALAVANFPQEAIGQMPTSLYFFAAIAMISKARQLDIVA
jgi:putative inorganic carbon (hco3(-)) transporter